MYDQKVRLTRISLVLATLLLIGCGLPGTARPHLSFVELQRGGVGDVPGLRGIWWLAVSPDGKHLYAVAYNDYTVAVFERHETTGKLTFVEAYKGGVGGLEGVGTPCSVAVSPDGSNVYVAGHWEHTVAVFSRDGTTGKLTPVEVQRDGVGDVDGLYAINWVTVSPDGKHVYTASHTTYKARPFVVGSVAVFSRDANTGRLSFVESHQEDLRGKAGLPHGAFSVTVSPDGKHVYAAGYIDSAVAIYKRDITTGRLAFVQTVQNGVGRVAGLGYPSLVAPSPDGRHIYVPSAGDHAVAAFSRDDATGMLTFIEVHRDGADGVDGLRGARSVAVSPNGHFVYVAGSAEHAVAVFTRDETTGKLSFLETQRDGVGGVDGLQGASSVATSPDADRNHIYVAGHWVQAITVFEALHP